MLRSDRAIDAVLVLALAVDVGLVLRTLIEPSWWFLAFHGREPASAGEIALLTRCAAHWAAFALFQGLALIGWRRWTPALLLVAGLRFSDVFTDWAYLAASDTRTALAWPLLLAPGALNWAMALFLAWAWRQRAEA